ncbi:ankyrin repeat domain-containing protein [Alistipes sp.]
MNGLNLDLQDDSGWTALHFAAQENSPEIIELLAGSRQT